MPNTAARGDGSVLVLEDDLTLRETIVSALQEEGFRARGAATVAEAWAELRRSAPSLLVMDGRVGGAAPAEFLTDVAALPQPPRVIVLSGAPGSKEFAAAFAVPVVMKPFGISTLVNAVTEGGALPRRSSAEPTGES